MGLDQFEALVHERRRIDRDLGPHSTSWDASRRPPLRPGGGDGLARTYVRNGPPDAVSVIALDVVQRAVAQSLGPGRYGSESTGSTATPGPAKQPA